MKIFHCDHCDQLIFFENFQCISCGHMLAYMPDLKVVGSLEKGEDDTWTSPLERAQGRVYRLCENYTKHSVCNWAVDADDPNPLCLSCRLTRVIPDLNVDGHHEGWYRLEVAKRRLVYTLLELGLPIANRLEDPEAGLTFEFRADAQEQPGVLTGHANGVITINVAEADDVEREKRRVHLHEPYRTLLGHFRHEVGHYYWDRLLKDSDRLDAFRAVFGDEQTDYGAALQRHYAQGAAGNWQDNFISAYATSHPWEDWAETWAHYLHMADTLEVAATCGLSLKPHRRDEPILKTVPNPLDTRRKTFDQLIDSWFPLTYLLNNLNRSLGMPDGYPFVLSLAVVEKLRFVHETIEEYRPEPRKPRPAREAQQLATTAG